MRIGAYENNVGDFAVVDFRKLLDGINHFCRKPSQTANEEARIKTIKRWFDGIPRKYRSMAREEHDEFVMRVKVHKHDLFSRIIKKVQAFCIIVGYLPAASINTQNALHPL
jgi:hypothetical protein